jgi:hypothetical protein
LVSDLNEHRPFADEGEVIATVNALRNQITSINEHIADNRANTKEQLDRIESQTAKTNGRVTKLELRNAFLSGGLALLALGFAGGVAWIGLLK